ncbi:serine hydrolase domain-containing protein [Streptomyces sp. NPDC006711]|uniref:serine hydrolase domain-containing protein n=1 Tax=unclassified Streptomyces TaxID=2593676 RepID=UPI0033D5E015
MSTPLHTTTNSPVSPTTSRPGQDRPHLRKVLDEVTAGGFLGVQLRVRDERGEWVAGAGAGELDGSAGPVTDGHFRIGSTTKSFVATVVLLLVAEGRIGLDAPAADHLPEFGLDRRITVRMLLRHTSGIFNHTGELYEDGTIVLGVPWQGKEWVEKRFATYRPEDLVRLSLSKPARFAPGTGWSYANTNYVLARLVIEHVTGRTFAEELSRLVLRPLGLTGTLAPGDSPEIPAPHNRGYYRYEDAGQERIVDVTRQNPSWVGAGGDMISTTGDLATYFSALMGGRLLPAGLLAEMRTPEATVGYGLGVFAQETGSGTVFHHNGATMGSAALMYASADGRTVLTAGLTWVDDADLTIAPAFQAAQQRFVEAVFSGRLAG